MEAHNISLALAEFSLPPPKRYTAMECDYIVTSLITRLKDSLVEENVQEVGKEEKALSKLKSLLIVRFITRGLEYSEGDGPEEKMETDEVPSSEVALRLAGSLRDKMFDFIMKDLPGRWVPLFISVSQGIIIIKFARVELATAWLNEEWYNDCLRAKQEPGRKLQYPIYLTRIVTRYVASLNPKDRTLQTFLLDLPEIPNDVLSIIREMCLHGER